MVMAIAIYVLPQIPGTQGCDRILILRLECSWRLLLEVYEIKSQGRKAIRAAMSPNKAVGAGCLTHPPCKQTSGNEWKEQFTTDRPLKEASAFFFRTTYLLADHATADNGR